MEIKADSATISLTTENTIPGVMKAMRALSEALAGLNNNRVPETGEPVVFGNGRFDIRTDRLGVMVVLGTEIGWIAQPFEVPAALSLVSQIAAVLRDGIAVAQADAEASKAKQAGAVQ